MSTGQRQLFRSAVCLAGAVPSFLSISARAQCQLHESQTLSALEAPAQFGTSVSLSGDVGIVGARLDAWTGTSTGSASLYRYGGADWTQEDVLTAADAAPDDLFGWSVGVDGDVAVIGAIGDDIGFEDAGSAYVFRFNPERSQWVQEQKILPPQPSFGSRFGHAVAVSGDAIVIATPFHDGVAAQSGVAYVYRFNGVTWAPEEMLAASDAAVGDHFGSAASIDGDVIVIGAGTINNGGGEAAYVFRFDPGTLIPGWVEEIKLTASDGEDGDFFGSSVSVDGNVIVVGSLRDDDGGTNSGSAYVYRYHEETGQWVEEAKLTASDATEFELFGNSVSVSAERAVIGKIHDQHAGFLSGSAYLYDFNGSSWIEEAKLTASEPAAGDAFGTSVAISGDMALVGATGADECPGDPTCNAGAVYVFGGLSDANGNGTPDGCECHQDLNADGLVNDLDLIQLLLCFGQPANPPCDSADINGDSTVNVLDLIELLLAFGTSCP